MKKLIPLLSLLSLSAFAEPTGDAVFNYTFFGNSSGRYTMVACDYAQPVVENAMMKFGASKIDVRCFGGITPTGVYPLSIRATYVAPVTTGATKVEKVKLESGPFPGDSNCDFDVGAIGALVRDFANVTVDRRRDYCFRGDTPYSFELNVTLPK